MAKYYEVRRDGSNVLMELARLPRKVVTIAKKTVVGNPVPAIRKGESGYGAWVIVSIHVLREYL